MKRTRRITKTVSVSRTSAREPRILPAGKRGKLDKSSSTVSLGLLADGVRSGEHYFVEYSGGRYTGRVGVFRGDGSFKHWQNSSKKVQDKRAPKAQRGRRPARQTSGLFETRAERNRRMRREGRIAFR